MIISDERMKQFISLCEKYFGYRPSDEEALEMATKLLEISQLIITKSE